MPIQKIILQHACACVRGIEWSPSGCAEFVFPDARIAVGVALFVQVASEICKSFGLMIELEINFGV